MRTTIAYKKHSAGILYVILTFFGVMLLVSAIAEKLLPLGIIGALLTVISAVLSIRFLSLPSNIIVLSEDGTLILPKGVTVSLESISDVSYRRASAKDYNTVGARSLCQLIIVVINTDLYPIARMWQSN